MRVHSYRPITALQIGAAIIIILTIALSGCAVPQPSQFTGIKVVAAENIWGSIAQQLGGANTQVISVISNPAIDPHDYEPTTSDARAVAEANIVIENGAGYDTWMEKLISVNATPGQIIINIASVVGKKPGDNPHLWYNPNYVLQAIQAITQALITKDAAHKSILQQLQTQYIQVGLAAYFNEIHTIQTQYTGVPIGSTESIFVYMAQALHMQLISPAAFMRDISEGVEPSFNDMALFTNQIQQKQIKVLVLNIQNETPLVMQLVKAAQANGIPIVQVSETPYPAGISFQTWQTQQLQALAAALKANT